MYLEYLQIQLYLLAVQSGKIGLKVSIFKKNYLEQIMKKINRRKFIISSSDFPFHFSGLSNNSVFP